MVSDKVPEGEGHAADRAPIPGEWGRRGHQGWSPGVLHAQFGSRDGVRAARRGGSVRLCSRMLLMTQPSGGDVRRDCQLDRCFGVGLHLAKGGLPGTQRHRPDGRVAGVVVQDDCQGDVAGVAQAPRCRDWWCGIGGGPDRVDLVLLIGVPEQGRVRNPAVRSSGDSPGVAIEQVAWLLPTCPVGSRSRWPGSCRSSRCSPSGTWRPWGPFRTIWPSADSRRGPQWLPPA